MKTVGELTLADDSGLEVDAINGQPGVFLHAFPVKVLLMKETTENFFALLNNIPMEKREPSFGALWLLYILMGKSIQPKESVAEEFRTGLSAIKGLAMIQYLFPMATMKPSHN